MSLPKFVIGMLFVIVVVAVWSYLDAASIGTVLLRAVACAVILQVGYFLVVFLMVATSAPRPAESIREAPETESSAKADEFGAKRSIH